MRRAGSILLIVIASVATAIGAWTGAERVGLAIGQIDGTTGTEGRLTLTAEVPDAPALSPGVPIHWVVRADIADPWGSLRMQVRREGDLVERAEGLQVLIQQCSVAWVFPADGAPTCSTGGRDLIGPVAFSDSRFGSPAGAGDATPVDAPNWELGLIADDEQEWFLVTLWIPDTPANRADESLMGIRAAVGLGLLAFEAEDPFGARPPGQSLPATGAVLPAALLLGLGIAGIVVGVGMVRR